MEIGNLLTMGEKKRICVVVTVSIAYVISVDNKNKHY